MGYSNAIFRENLSVVSFLRNIFSLQMIRYSHDSLSAHRTNFLNFSMSTTIFTAISMESTKIKTSRFLTPIQTKFRPHVFLHLCDELVT